MRVGKDSDFGETEPSGKMTSRKKTFFCKTETCGGRALRLAAVYTEIDFKHAI